MFVLFGWKNNVCDAGRVWLNLGFGFPICCISYSKENVSFNLWTSHRRAIYLHYIGEKKISLRILDNFLLTLSFYRAQNSKNGCLYRFSQSSEYIVKNTIFGQKMLILKHEYFVTWWMKFFFDLFFGFYSIMALLAR